MDLYDSIFDLRRVDPHLACSDFLAWELPSVTDRMKSSSIRKLLAVEA